MAEYRASSECGCAAVQLAEEMCLSAIRRTRTVGPLEESVWRDIQSTRSPARYDHKQTLLARLVSRRGRTLPIRRSQ